LEKETTTRLIDCDGYTRKDGGSVLNKRMAWKVRGRVGDSPIIGAGLYVDNESAQRLQPVSVKRLLKYAAVFNC